MDQQQTDRQRVSWGPSQRIGEIVDTIPMEGDHWSRVRSEGWQERMDLPGFYQRAPVPGLTKPCELVIRTADLSPVEPATAPTPVQPVGLREDATAALASLRDILAMGLIGRQREAAIALERRLLGIQSAVEQG